MKSLMVLMLIGASGCTASISGMFDVGSLSNEDAGAVNEALVEWRDKTNGKDFAELVYGAENKIYIGVVPCPSPSRKYSDAGCITFDTPEVVGGQRKETVWLDPNNILCKDLTRHECLRRVALHEFGHHFGKPDSSKMGIVMSDVDPVLAPHLTQEDLDL